MWCDRLTKQKRKQLPARVLPGRYLLSKTEKTLNDHTLLSDNQILVADGGESCRLDNESYSFVLPNKAVQTKIELFSKALETLHADIKGNPESPPSPLLPATIINEQSHLLHFEEKLLDVVNKGHLHQISLRPRLDLRYDEEVIDISRARRMAKGALVHLASHSECWQLQTLSGVIPKKILARFSEDDFSIYENRIYARLLDKTEQHLRLRIDTLKQLQSTLSQALEFYKTEDLHYLLRRDICALWGQTFDEMATNEASRLLIETLATLEMLFKTITGLKQTGLYLLISRHAQADSTLHRTNILVHDPHYRHLAILWDMLNHVQQSKHQRPDEIFKQQTFLAEAYSEYTGLMLRHVLQPYMALESTANWAGRQLTLKKSGLEWELNIDDSPSPLLTIIPWFCVSPKEDINTNIRQEDKRIIAWPALDNISNDTAYEQEWIALSPFDLYCAERFGKLIDSILIKQLVLNYGVPLAKIPLKCLELASQSQGVALVVNNKQHELALYQTISESKLLDLTHCLKKQNAKAQANELVLQAKAIQALECCPICFRPVELSFQQPAGFKANCISCKVERYFYKNEDGYQYKQTLDGDITFRTTGRRSLLLVVKR